MVWFSSATVVEFYSALDTPRMRGTLKDWQLVVLEYRIIPAHAGNSVGSNLETSPIPDHPRACRELEDGFLLLGDRHGSSPRMRGTLSTENSE